MNRALFGYLARRYALRCALCAVFPILIGALVGFVWPDYRKLVQTATGALALLQKLFGSEFLDLATPAGFFHVPFAHPVTILALVTAATLPTSALPGAARGRGSLDLLLATPLTRGALVRTVALFTLPFAVLLGLAPLAGAWIGGSLSGVVSELPLRAYLRVSLETALLFLFFAGASQLLSVASADAFAALGRLALLVVLSFMLEIAGTLWQEARFLKYCGPFGFYEPAQVISGVAHYARDCSILGGAAAACFLAAIALEQRRRSV
jgi:hypothetical protein